MNMFSRGEFGVIKYLTRHPHEFYGREIAKQIGASVGGTNQVLNRLYRVGLLRRVQRGRNYFYSTRESPLLTQTKILLTLFELEPFLQQLKPLAEKIILYGSCAQGEDTEESDVDLVLIAGVKEEVGNRIKRFSRGYPRKIQTTVVTPGEWLELRAKDEAFYKQVAKGMVLWRRTHDERI